MKQHTVNQHPTLARLCLSLGLLHFTNGLAAPPKVDQNCLLKALQTADDQMSVGELKQQCQQAPQIASTPSDTPTSQADPNSESSSILDLLDQRLEQEVKTQNNPFVITPHRVNYFMLSHYSGRMNQAPFEEDAGIPIHYRNQELQFQLSIKTPLPLEMTILGKQLRTYAVYTNRSFWQFFDDEDSIPFRETNHEPEVWAQMHTDIDFFNYNLHTVSIGMNHQSNGQTRKLSRGWNRLFVQGKLQHKQSYLSFKTWRRFDEQDEFDNSFNYGRYLGDFELEIAHRMKQNTFAMTVRNRYQWNEYGSIQLEYTYPLTSKLKGYVQLFNGYGDSLIDMDHFSQKIGFGIVLTDRI